MACGIVINEAHQWRVQQESAPDHLCQDDREELGLPDYLVTSGTAPIPDDGVPDGAAKEGRCGAPPEEHCANADPREPWTLRFACAICEQDYRIREHNSDCARAGHPQRCNQPGEGQARLGLVLLGASARVSDHSQGSRRLDAAPCKNLPAGELNAAAKDPRRGRRHTVCPCELLRLGIQGLDAAGLVQHQQ